MFDNFCLFLNLHYFKRDSYIAKWLSSPHSPGFFQRGLEGKAKALVAVTHLALLGVREQEAAFWASVTEEGAAFMGCSFRCHLELENSQRGAREGF